MVYKGIFIDLECLYMPEIKTLKSIQFATGKRPCVAHLPDIERGFDSIEEAKGFIDRNLKRIRKKCEEKAKEHGLPF